MSIQKPQISDFLDIVDFLKANFDWRKSIQIHFSYNVWQQELGIGSRTLLRLILTRKRRISPKTAVVMKSNLQLSMKDAHYFDLLLSFSQARTQQERKSLGENLLRAQRSM